MLARIREWVVPVSLMVASAAAIGQVRPGLFDTVTKIRENSDTYALPPPEQMPVVSLGYRAAVADMIWASLLVTQGLRIGQKRRFEFADRYFDSIFALEPTYRNPYLMVDTILTFVVGKAKPKDAYNTRRLLEQGMRERPNDAQLFLQAGSFMAYLAPSIIPDEEHAEWRLTGAKLMMRAGELGAADVNLQWHSLASVATLSRAGEKQAAIDFLERIFEVTEDAELRQEIIKQLWALKAEASVDKVRESDQRFDAVWRGQLPFVSRSMLLLLGPPTRVFSCAGPGRFSKAGCLRDWPSWAEGKLVSPGVPGAK